MIEQNVKALLAQVPAGVEVVAAVKTRTAAEIMAAVNAGIRIIGHNYIQEARALADTLPQSKNFGRHFIGHLQSNKARDAVKLCDTVQTVDSVKLARALNGECAKLGKTIDILVEINSGKEENKAGVMPEDADELVLQIRELSNIRLKGLMTMGPFLDEPQDMRPYFKLTKEIFDRINSSLPAAEKMTCLSMGMTDSWRVAVEEGSNMIRVGTLLFGPR